MRDSAPDPYQDVYGQIDAMLEKSRGARVEAPEFGTSLADETRSEERVLKESRYYADPSQTQGGGGMGSGLQGIAQGGLNGAKMAQAGGGGGASGGLYANAATGAAQGGLYGNAATGGVASGGSAAGGLDFKRAWKHAKDDSTIAKAIDKLF